MKTRLCQRIVVCSSFVALAFGLSLGGIIMATPQNQKVSETLTIVDLDGTKISFSFEDLRKMPQEMEEECICVGKSAGFIGIFDYTGVRLRDLLAKAKAAQGASEYKQENMYLVFRGTDGYQVIASWTELAQPGDGQRALVVLDKGLEPLPPSEGKFRLSLPGDKYVGRSVKCLDTIEIRLAEGFVDLKKHGER